MVRKAALAAVIMLGATPAFAAAPLNPGEKAAIVKAFDALLLDGLSARWRWPTPAEEGTAITYCGFVNGKNSMGAYTGYRPFMVALVRRNKPRQPIASLATLGNPGSDDEQITITLCTRHGYDVSEIPAE